jgi:hypothetical protein
MIRVKRLLACAVLAFAALGPSGCDSQGIGIGVPASGARWGAGGTGPDVLVAGGPVYR